MLKLLFSFWGIVMVCQQAICQKDSVKAIDSSKVKAVVKSKIRVGFDISRVFMSATQKEFKGAEGSLDVNFGQLIYEAHLGYAAHSQRLKAYTPISNGVYGSFGISKNLFEDNNNILAFGGRIAGSSYSFQPTDVKITEPSTNQEITIDLAEHQYSAFWLELVGSMRAKVFGWVLMGFEVRLKPRLGSKGNGYNPYAIPGYGLYKNNTSFGFNYFIYINLPTGKSK